MMIKWRRDAQSQGQDRQSNSRPKTLTTLYHIDQQQMRTGTDGINQTGNIRRWERREKQGLFYHPAISQVCNADRNQ